MAAATQMPMPNDPVTNERLESVLLGIATQIASAVEGAKSDMMGLITEAELRWQSKLAEHLEAQGSVPPSELEVLRTELAQSQAEVDGKLRAQDSELQQLQQGLRDLEAQARRAETTTNQRLEERTDVVLDTMTEHFDVVFEELKAAVETLSWKVASQANESGGSPKTTQARLVSWSRSLRAGCSGRRTPQAAAQDPRR